MQPVPAVQNVQYQNSFAAPSLTLLKRYARGHNRCTVWNGHTHWGQ